MRLRLGRRSGAAAAVLVALVVATPASPAGAAEGEPTITIESPQVDAVLTSDTVTVSGRVTAGDLLVEYRLKDVTLTADNDRPQTVQCQQSPCSFSWTLKRPLNGSYRLTVSATQVGLVGAGPSGEAKRSFAVAAPPAKPVLDPPKVSDSRNVELSWSRNTEADMLYYALFRMDPGATEPKRVGGSIKHPTSGAKVSFTDTTTSSLAGGDVAYSVYAVRRGATSGSELVSAASAVRTATVPVLATTSTSVTLSPGAPAGGPTTTARQGAPAGVDLSGFLSSRSAPMAPPVVTVPQPPDTGFEASLPFGARPPSLDDIEEGEAEAVPPRGQTTIISRISPGRPLVPVAGGLVLLLLAMHMRVLNRRTRPVAEGGDLPVEAAAAVPALPPPPPPPPPPPRLPAPRHDPEPAPFDVEADADEQDWAPVAPVNVNAEPQPEPEPEPEVATLGAPEPEPDPDPDPESEREPLAVNPDAVEVVEVVSSNRRRLAPSGTR